MSRPRRRSGHGIHVARGSARLEGLRTGIDRRVGVPERRTGHDRRRSLHDPRAEPATHRSVRVSRPLPDRHRAGRRSEPDYPRVRSVRPRPRSLRVPPEPRSGQLDRPDDPRCRRAAQGSYDHRPRGRRAASSGGRCARERGERGRRGSVAGTSVGRVLPQRTRRPQVVRPGQSPSPRGRRDRRSFGGVARSRDRTVRCRWRCSS